MYLSKSNSTEPSCPKEESQHTEILPVAEAIIYKNKVSLYDLFTSDLNILDERLEKINPIIKRFELLNYDKTDLLKEALISICNEEQFESLIPFMFQTIKFLTDIELVQICDHICCVYKFDPDDYTFEKNFEYAECFTKNLLETLKKRYLSVSTYTMSCLYILGFKLNKSNPIKNN